MKFLSKTCVMIDLETLSTCPDAAILSIGACKFKFDSEIYSKFYINVDPRDCKAHGLRIEKDAIDWWAKQSQEARDAFKDPKPVSLEDALSALTAWWNEDAVEKSPISNGAGFDIPILEIAYKKLGRATPWKYYNVLCFRTILTLLDLNNNKIRKAEKELTHHNALSDSISQTNTLIGAFKQ